MLGIDPGSRCTGYGIITYESGRFNVVTYGQIKTHNATLPLRLQEIDEALRTLISAYAPTEAAIEQVFTYHNPAAALKLGQARGAALVALRAFALPISEYSARQIKLATVGYGGAQKKQIQHMVKTLLQLSSLPPPDAADALAIALCHASCQRYQKQLHASIQAEGKI